MPSSTRISQRLTTVKGKQQETTKHGHRTEAKPKLTKRKPSKKAWNDMSHLVLRRFLDDDPSLTPGARRDRARRPYIAIAEHDPSGRATCKRCGDLIAPKGILRLSLMLECEKGYRNICTLHEGCFWKHSETKKLRNVDEIHLNGITEGEKNWIQKAFKKQELHGS